jgi:accessory gene regulator protein AgrB
MAADEVEGKFVKRPVAHIRNNTRKKEARRKVHASVVFVMLLLVKGDSETGVSVKFLFQRVSEVADDGRHPICAPFPEVH